jgi:hypothetical protein
MNAQLTGSVKMAGEAGRGVSVDIHLGDETLTLGRPAAPRSAPGLSNRSASPPGRMASTSVSRARKWS